jgi:hypothetical protein
MLFRTINQTVSPAIAHYRILDELSGLDELKLMVTGNNPH